MSKAVQNTGYTSASVAHRQQGNDKNTLKRKKAGHHLSNFTGTAKALHSSLVSPTPPDDQHVLMNLMGLTDTAHLLDNNALLFLDEPHQQEMSTALNVSPYAHLPHHQQQHLQMLILHQQHQQWCQQHQQQMHPSPPSVQLPGSQLTQLKNLRREVAKRRVQARPSQ